MAKEYQKTYRDLNPDRMWLYKGWIMPRKLEQPQESITGNVVGFFLLAGIFALAVAFAAAYYPN